MPRHFLYKILLSPLSVYTIDGKGVRRGIMPVSKAFIRGVVLLWPFLLGARIEGFYLQDTTLLEGFRSLGAGFRRI